VLVGRNKTPQYAPPPGLPEIYAQHADFVFRNLRRLGVHDSLIDDAVQDVFLVVHRRLGDFEARAQVTTWLFGIVLRVAQSYRRSAMRRRARLSDAPSAEIEQIPVTAIESPVELLERRRRQLGVRAAHEQKPSVAQLAAPQRRIPPQRRHPRPARD